MLRSPLYEDRIRRPGIDYIILDELPVLPICSICGGSGAEGVSSFLADNAELAAEIADSLNGRVVADDADGYVSRICRIID